VKRRPVFQVCAFFPVPRQPGLSLSDGAQTPSQGLATIRPSEHNHPRWFSRWGVGRFRWLQFRAGMWVALAWAGSDPSPPQPAERGAPFSPRLMTAPIASHPLPGGEGSGFSGACAPQWVRPCRNKSLLPSPRGEGGPRQAYSSVVAGRMRGHFRHPCPPVASQPQLRVGRPSGLFIDQARKPGWRSR
jgi:hypothetical protein